MIAWLKKNSDFIPLLIFGVTLLLSIESGLIYYIRSLLAYFFVLISTGLYFYNKKSYYWAIEILLLLWVIDFLWFSPHNLGFSFSFTHFDLTIQVYPLIILGFTTKWFKDSFFDWFKGRADDNEGDLPKEQKIGNRFLTKFESKTDDELRKILNDESRLEEARGAAKQVLKKRKSGE